MAQYTHLFGGNIETNVSVAVAYGFGASSGAPFSVSDFGSIAPGAIGNSAWFEYGARVGYRFNDRLVVDAFLLGTAGGEAGNFVHGGVGVRYSFRLRSDGKWRCQNRFLNTIRRARHAGLCHNCAAGDRSRRSFDAMMAERNVTRATRYDGLSQAAMSKALNRLRHLLDDRIFELHLRGFRSTIGETATSLRQPLVLVCAATVHGGFRHSAAFVIAGRFACSDR